MINLYAQRLMMLAVSMWHPEKAECFAKHMAPILTQERLKDWQVDHWALLFEDSMLHRQYLNTQYIITDDMLKVLEEKLDE